MYEYELYTKTTATKLNKNNSCKTTLKSGINFGLNKEL